MTNRLAELNMLTDHHDRHWMQMEIAHVEGRKADAEYHRLEMGKGQERALEIEHQLQDEYRDQSNRDLMARYARDDNGPAFNEYACWACEGIYNRRENPPVYIDGEVEYCPACWNPDEFNVGQRVRFAAFPSLVCTVTARGTDPETGQPRYQLSGSEGPLGCWYVHDDLEAL